MRNRQSALIRAIPWLLLILGAAFIVVALVGGTEMNVVFTRASRICLECIGIG